MDAFSPRDDYENEVYKSHAWGLGIGQGAICLFLINIPICSYLTLIDTPLLNKYDIPEVYYTKAWSE